MKTKTTLLILVLLALSIRGFSQIGIGTTSPNASAALDVTSTTSGLLPPRMTELQRNNINAPAAGLMVYCTDCGAKGEPQYYNGTSWVNMVGGAAAPLTSTVFVAPGVPITFLAHNLGANNSLDPHTPVQGIHGNYYQWGILAHVADASTPATAITPWNTTTAANGAWADGSKTANDPCPTGYRVPTNAQWLLVDSYNTQTTTGSFINNATNFGAARHFGAGANKLTLPAAGSRKASAGALSLRGNYGYYWSSSTENLSQASHLNVTTGNAFTSSNNRAFGFSVRCVSE
jgi:uncharacterized protein (TIGR02145 family)